MKDPERRKWFETWCRKKTESDYTFKLQSKEWLWLAFLAGAHLAEWDIECHESLKRK